MAKEIKLTRFSICAFCEKTLDVGEPAIMDGWKGERIFCTEFCLADYRMHKQAKRQAFKNNSLDAMLDKFSRQYN